MSKIDTNKLLAVARTEALLMDGLCALSPLEMSAYLKANPLSPTAGLVRHAIDSANARADGRPITSLASEDDPITQQTHKALLGVGARPYKNNEGKKRTFRFYKGGPAAESHPKISKALQSVGYENQFVGKNRGYFHHKTGHTVFVGDSVIHDIPSKKKRQGAERDGGLGRARA